MPEEARAPTSAAPASSVPSLAADAPAAPADEATRRARFEQRPTLEPPAAWPAPWKGLVPGLEGRLLKATTEVRTRAAGEPIVVSVGLSFRVFGQDAEVEASLLKALKPLGFKGDSLPETPLEDATGRWSVEVSRLKGEAPRETQFDLAWHQEPPTPAAPKECKKPTGVPLPAEVPAWLNGVTSTLSTRRRVIALTEYAPNAQAVDLTMLFQNGYAHDEGVGHYTALAQQRGFKLAGGSGIKQTWRHPDGSELSWRPTRRDLGLGCEVVGPVLELSWRSGKQ